MGRKKRKELSKEMHCQVRGVILVALSLFCFAGLIWSGETGRFGLIINMALRTLAGDAAIIIPFFMLLFSLRYLMPKRKLKFNIRILGFIIFLLTVLLWVHFRFIIEQPALLASNQLFFDSILLGFYREGGGVLGGIFASVSYSILGQLGSYILIISLFVISVLMVFDISLYRIFARLFKALSSVTSQLGQSLFKALKAYRRKPKQVKSAVENGTVIQQQIPVTYHQGNAEINNGVSFDNVVEAEMNSANNQDITVSSTLGTASKKEITGDKADTSTAIISNKNTFDREYVLPPVKLLATTNSLVNNHSPKYAKERAKLLESTLNSFGVKARVIHVQTGPTVTRFEVQPEAGVKVSRIINLSDDIALNLAAPLVRIEAPIPGKAALGIEVPNKIIDLVSLREVIQDLSFQHSSSPLSIALGKDITGIAVVTDLAKMPHLLIAGSTGAGKSVCLNTLITSILYKAEPNQVRFLLIDPKVVELSIYNGIPHLLTPVVTDPRKASLALKNMVKEMTKRYEVFASVGVRDISAYNELANKDDTLDTFPLVVIVIDELADLMLIAPGEVEDSIARLAQMSRAAGIHLIIATQRPSVDVLTGVIKANITSRIAFTVSSQFDSRTILDMAGAEKLLGRGDMLFYPVGSVKPFRVQGAFISDTEVKNVTDFLRANCEENALSEQMTFETPEDQDNEALDSLFIDAVELVVNTGQASISLLQRRFRIGYARAARLIDDLELKGIVGKFEGSKPREVLVTREYVEQLKEDMDKVNE